MLLGGGALNFGELGRFVAAVQRGHPNDQSMNGSVWLRLTSVYR